MCVGSYEECLRGMYTGILNRSLNEWALQWITNIIESKMVWEDRPQSLASSYHKIIGFIELISCYIYCVVHQHFRSGSQIFKRLWSLGSISKLLYRPFLALGCCSSLALQGSSQNPFTVHSLNAFWVIWLQEMWTPQRFLSLTTTLSQIGIESNVAYSSNMPLSPSH